MLQQRDTRFFDVVIEQQLKKVSIGSQLCSVRATDLDTLMSMKDSLRGQTNLNFF